MQNLLALETSGARCSVCLLIDGNRFEITEHVDRRHNELLLSMIASVTHEAGLTSRSLAGRLQSVAFSCGPGSFTGVRIAAAAAQAIALAADAGVVPVVSSQVLALAAASKAAGHTDSGIITLIRSRKNLYYLATYRMQDGIPLPDRVDELLEGEPSHEWLDAHADWFAAGSRPEWWPAARSVDESIQPDASQVCTLALARLEDSEGLDAAQALPLYLAGDSPWRPN